MCPHHARKQHRSQQRSADVGNREGAHASQQCERDPFREQLAQETTARNTKREANRDFAATP
jgi:hypothetical protein